MPRQRTFAEDLARFTPGTRVAYCRHYLESVGDRSRSTRGYRGVVTEVRPDQTSDLVVRIHWEHWRDDAGDAAHHASELVIIPPPDKVNPWITASRVRRTEWRSKPWQAGLHIAGTLRQLLETNKHGNRVARLLLKAAETGGGNYLNPRHPGNYIAFRETAGMISYMPRGREQQYGDRGRWLRAGRQDMKPGRWAAHTLHPRLMERITADELNDFVTRFKCEEQKGMLRMEVTTDVQKAYTRHHFSNRSAIDSCMWDDPVGEFYEYAGAKAVICWDGENKARGRAIFWPQVKVVSSSGDKHVKAGDTFSLMDRIYADSPEVVLWMKEWAIKNGHAHKYEQNADSNTDLVVPDPNKPGDGVYVSRSLKVQPADRDAMVDVAYKPYVDTMCYRSECDNLFNYCRNHVTYHNTDGTAMGEEDDHEGQVLTIDGDWIDEGDARNVNGDYYETSDSRICFCERGRDYILRSEAYEIDIGRGRYHYYHEDHVSSPE